MLYRFVFITHQILKQGEKLNELTQEKYIPTFFTA